MVAVLSMPSYHEVKGVCLVLVDGILLEDTGTATAIAQSQDGTIQAEISVAQIGVGWLLEIEVVLGAIEVGHAIGQGRETERRLEGDYLQEALAALAG